MEIMMINRNKPWDFHIVIYFHGVFPKHFRTCALPGSGSQTEQFLRKGVGREHDELGTGAATRSPTVLDRIKPLEVG